MKKEMRKKANLFTVFFMIISFIVNASTAFVQVEASEKNGNSTGQLSKVYPGQSRSTTTPYITVDGKAAWCYEPYKEFPVDQEYVDEVYDDIGIYNIMYYAYEKGWTQPNTDYLDVWVAIHVFKKTQGFEDAGFKADANVAYLLDKAENPTAPVGKFDIKDKIQTAGVDKDNKRQLTNWYTPDTNGTDITYTITVPKGITAVLSDGRELGEGTYSLATNIKFKLSAPLDYTGDVSFDVPTNMRDKATLIFKPKGNDNVQKLLNLGYKKDPIKVLGVKATFFARTGDVKITKLDKETGEVVPNTEFKVSYDGKSQTVKTNGKGEATIEEILHGTKVTVTETFVPNPYILDSKNTQEVVVQAGETAKVEFRNERATGKSTLTKVDKTTETDKPLNPNYPMTGAKYGWFKEDGTLLKESTLDKNQTATVEGQPLGNYYWKETVAPVGYTLDPEKHVVELTYKDQDTPVVVKDSKSNDDVIRMNIDWQKLIQNATNEMFKNGVEFTAKNQRTGEEIVQTTATVDGKKGYLKFSDLPLDDYVITETKGVEGYDPVDPIEIKHSYDKETKSFTFTVTDQKSGNVLNEETFTQEELSKGENVDLGTYTLKDKATVNEEPSVGISTQAHTGDGKTQTFTWGEDVKFYDDVTITTKNIPLGTVLVYETIQVAVYPDGKEKDVWSSGKVDLKLTDEKMTERVLSEYDYKKDPEGTRYYFKELVHKPVEAEHNFDGKEKTQDITPVTEPKKETPKQETPKETPKGSLPYTGEEMMRGASVLGLLLLLGVGGAMYLKHKKKTDLSEEKPEENN